MIPATLPAESASLLDLMREAQEAGMPMMKWAMIDSAWVRRPFVPKVVGGNRADEPMKTERMKS